MILELTAQCISNHERVIRLFLIDVVYKASLADLYNEFSAFNRLLIRGEQLSVLTYSAAVRGLSINPSYPGGHISSSVYERAYPEASSGL